MVDPIPTDQDVKSPPATEANAIENYPFPPVHEHKQKHFGSARIVVTVGVVVLVATCAASIIAVRIKRSRVYGLQELEGYSLPMSTNIDYAFSTPEEFPQSSPRSSSTMLLRNMPIVHYGTAETMSRRKSFTQMHKSPVVTRSYSITELRKATNSFSDESLLGKGSLGSVFKAEFPDGQILAVKNYQRSTIIDPRRGSVPRCSF